MKRAPVVLALCLALAAALFAPLVAGASMRQSLAITLRNDNAATQTLDHYQVSRPIAVRVAGDTTKFDRMLVTASGPNGAAVQAPLERTSDGFSGTLRLATPGLWTLAVTTQLGQFSTNVANVVLDVVEPRGISLLAALLFVLAAGAATAGGALLFSRTLRRRFVLATIRS